MMSWPNEAGAVIALLSNTIVQLQGSLEFVIRRLEAEQESRHQNVKDQEERRLKGKERAIARQNTISDLAKKLGQEQQRSVALQDELRQVCSDTQAKMDDINNQVYAISLQRDAATDNQGRQATLIKNLRNKLKTSKEENSIALQELGETSYLSAQEMDKALKVGGVALIQRDILRAKITGGAGGTSPNPFYIPSAKSDDRILSALKETSGPQSNSEASSDMEKLAKSSTRHGTDIFVMLADEAPDVQVDILKRTVIRLEGQIAEMTVAAQEISESNNRLRKDADQARAERDVMFKNFKKLCDLKGVEFDDVKPVASKNRK